MDFISEAFEKGGWGMWPILITSIFSLTVIIERLIYLYFRAAANKNLLVTNIQKRIFQGKVDDAIKVCSMTPSPLSRIIKAGLLKVNRSDEEVQAAMDETSLREVPRIEERTGYLAMLGNVAMLLGLLGTISGLIKSFGAVAGVDPSKKAEMLAAGISEAMNCTAFGLIVAILSLLSYAIFMGRTQRLLDDINESTVHILNLVVSHRNAIKMPTQKEAT